jgi:hypothetical protein
MRSFGSARDQQVFERRAMSLTAKAGTFLCGNPLVAAAIAACGPGIAMVRPAVQSG